MNKNVVLSLAVFGLFAFGSDALARDIVSASNTAVSTVKTVAQALAVLGVVGGGAVMQLPGLGDVGKRIAASGLVGCVCAFGAPAFISLMKTVFGG